MNFQAKGHATVNECRSVSLLGNFKKLLDLNYCLAYKYHFILLSKCRVTGIIVTQMVHL